RAKDGCAWPLGGGQCLPWKVLSHDNGREATSSAGPFTVCLESKGDSAGARLRRACLLYCAGFLTVTEKATNPGTKAYAKRFDGRAAEGHFRQAQGLGFSSLGIGTYLGQPDERTDAAYTSAIVRAVESGINVIDA